MSRNYEDNNWIEGIGYDDGRVNYTGLNEIITEYLAVQITGKYYKEGTHVYQMFFILIDRILDVPTCNFNEICKNYFKSNGIYFYNVLNKIFTHYNINTTLTINSINEGFQNNDLSIIHTLLCIFKNLFK